MEIKTEDMKLAIRETPLSQRHTLVNVLLGISWNRALTRGASGLRSLNRLPKGGRVKDICSFMSKDHDRLDGIFNEFQRSSASDLAKAKKLFAEFAEGLTTHIRWEEEILFPVFEDKTGMRHGGPTAVIRMEHQQIKSLLEKIQVNIGQRDLENQLVEILTSHNAQRRTNPVPRH